MYWGCPVHTRICARVGLSSRILKGSLGLVHLVQLDRSRVMRVIHFLDVQLRLDLNPQKESEKTMVPVFKLG